MAWYVVGVASQEKPVGTKIQRAAVVLSCPGGNQQCLGEKVAYADKTDVYGIVAMSASRLINFVLWASRAINRIIGEGGKDAHLELIDVGGEVLLAWTTPKLPAEFRRVTDVAEARRLLRVRSAPSVENRAGFEGRATG